MKRYNYPMTFALLMVPLLGFFGTGIYVYYYGIVWQEPVLLILGWFFSGMGITFGYHRLFAHRSFKAHPAVQFIAMLCGSAALQNNIIKWCSDHRWLLRHDDRTHSSDDRSAPVYGWWTKSQLSEEPLASCNSLQLLY